MMYAAKIPGGLDVDKLLTREEAFQLHKDSVELDVVPIDDDPPFLPETSAYCVASIQKGNEHTSISCSYYTLGNCFRR